jgi:hypothetical protein
MVLRLQPSSHRAKQRHSPGVARQQQVVPWIVCATTLDDLAAVRNKDQIALSARDFVLYEASAHRGRQRKSMMADMVHLKEHRCAPTVSPAHHAAQPFTIGGPQTHREMVGCSFDGR